MRRWGEEAEMFLIWEEGIVAINGNLYAVVDPWNVDVTEL